MAFVRHTTTGRSSLTTLSQSRSVDLFADIFDPADFLGNARQKADVKRWRESELTHGRVAMLASLGFITQEQIIDFPNLPFPHVEGNHPTWILPCSTFGQMASNLVWR